MASLLDELALLAYDDASGFNKSSNLDVGLGGAILLELTLAERVDVVGGRVQVVDARATGDRILDAALSDIAADKPRKPAAVLGRIARGKRRLVVEDLVERGVLRHRRERLLGIFPYSRHLPGRPAVEAEARARLRAAADAGAAADARTAALASLVYALQLEKAAFPGDDHRRIRKTLKTIAEGSWAGDATRQAVEAAQTAVMVAITTAATVGAISASGS